ncbi:hypothetical protein PFICI_09378 [Pestalotiopsis fici W106-1]|uniref:Uncharacterized protein n=1 Tax=Pestalotiopsis fici (strain W106-1 / CGMCC3.15140) TaxID=1229662 RepID=W3X095_PESFW|nr:uncharacterized protein PFICI_09378 [Pestalotiopsis fici W106-1]ETS79525.1 hypothetical protein PFICI_09378 [Pestalotiopsis fici W106-1]
MNCGIHDNTTIGPTGYDAQYWQFSTSMAKNATCSERTYLRPDTAGSIIPWPYALVWLLIHFPLVLIRATRWQKVQVLSLVLAATSIGWSVEAYLSTQRRPDEVLVWAPLTVILDVGAVMQLAFLIMEDFAEHKGFVPPWYAFSILMGGLRKQPPKPPRSPSLRSPTEPKVANINHIELAVVTNGPAADTGVAQLSKGKAFIVVLSILLFFGLASLQIIGLVSAINGLAVKDTLESTWCSPMFESFAIGVLDGNCRLHSVSSSASRGIGCIKLSGAQQAGWLAGTVGVLIASLVLELADMLVLTLVTSKSKWRGVKMRRPWCTMFCGVAILVFYVIYGLLEASRLPSGMPEVVWVFRKEPSLGIETVCRGIITPAGVRGSIMGWTDGFLSNWGRTYFG